MRAVAMINKKVVFVFVTIVGLSGFCNGNFYIASAPDTIKFISSGNSVVQRRELSGIINFLMSLPSNNLHGTASWPGVEKIDIFNPPRGNLLITLHLPKGNQFVLTKYIMEYSTDDLDSRVSPVYELNSALVNEYQNSNLVQSFVLPNQFRGSSFDEVDTRMIRDRLNKENSVINGLPFKIEFLNPVSDIDIHLFGEIQILVDAAASLNVGKADERESAHVLLTSLDVLAQKYGSDSHQVREAIELFQYYIPQFIEEAKNKFQGSLLCEVDVSRSPPAVSDYLIRHSRSLLQADAQPVVSDSATNFTLLNLAEPNRAEFAVVFNIVLWLMVGFFLAVLAASYSMWYMDPGKDNIVYRVTSTRMKSD